MTHVSEGLKLYVMYGFYALVFALICAAMRERSFLRRARRDEMVFRKPGVMRVMTMILGLLMSIAGPLLYWHSFIVGGGSRNEAMRVVAWAMFALLDITVGVFLVSCSGPEELSLSLDRHTYRRVSGWPLFPITWSGEWDDMAGVYVISAGSRGAAVGVLWRHSKRRIMLLRLPDTTQLGRFDTKRAADRFAEEMAAKLGLPRVTLPQIGP